MKKDNNFKIMIEKKLNKYCPPVKEVYDFQSYANMLRCKMLSTLESVEEVIGRDSDAYRAIRKKMLDCANDVGRIPSCLYYKGIPCYQIDMSEWLADMVEKEEMKKYLQELEDGKVEE